MSGKSAVGRILPEAQSADLLDNEGGRYVPVGKS
jgi:hypothetical protein